MITQEQIKTKLNEISEIENLNRFDVEKLFKTALQQEFKNRFNIYMGDNIRVDDDISFNANMDLNLNRINEEFGSILEFEKNKAISYLNVYIRDFDGSEYRKAEKSVLKGNKIIGLKAYDLYSGLYSVVDKMYNLIYLLTEDKNLSDYKEFHDYINEHNLKESLYNMFGEVKIKDFTFKLFKNGRLDITFKDDTQAKTFFNELKRLQENKHKIKGFKF